MNKFYDTLTNTRGDVLPGYRAQVVNPNGTLVDIFADRSKTPFTDANGGTVNYATADSEGLVEFYWEAATGQIFQMLDPAGDLVKSIEGFADNYVLDNFSGSLTIDQVVDLGDELLDLNNGLAARPTTADLASTDPGKGAALSGFKLPYADAVAETLYDVAKRTVWIEQFGAVPDDPGFDNHDAILKALYSGAKLVLAGEGTFYTSPLFVGRQADGVRFQGKGYSTVLSLIGDYSGGISNQRALLSIPASGDPYGGAFEGAHNFIVDQIRFYGGDATGDNATSTVGFRSHSQNGGGYGTIWTHGFTKHGVLIGGIPTDFDGGTLYTWDNGNRAGLTTGGQGIGIGCPLIADPTIIKLGRVVSWGNGLANTGFGIDFADGSCTVGELITRDNGISSFKVAGSTRQKVIIGKVVSENDASGLNAASPCCLSNGDFELIQIGSLSITNFIGGSGLSVKHNGIVKIGTAYIADIPNGAGIEIGASGTIIDTDIGSASIYRTGGIGASLLGSGTRLTARLGRIYVEDSGNFGVYSTAHAFHADSIETRNANSAGHAVQFAGTPESVFVGNATMHHDTFAGNALRIVNTVTTARILSATISGSYSGAIQDSAGTNILPRKKAATVSDPTGGTNIDTECRTQLAAVIDALQAAGLMA